MNPSFPLIFFPNEHLPQRATSHSRARVAVSPPLPSAPAAPPPMLTSWKSMPPPPPPPNWDSRAARLWQHPRHLDHHHRQPASRPKSPPIPNPKPRNPNTKGLASTIARGGGEEELSFVDWCTKIGVWELLKTLKCDVAFPTIIIQRAMLNLQMCVHQLAM